MKKRKFNYRHIIVWSLFIPLIIGIVKDFMPLINRLFLSLKCFVMDFAYYFCRVFIKVKMPQPSQPYDTIFSNVKIGDVITILPRNFAIFAEQVKSFFVMFINLDMWKYCLSWILANTTGIINLLLIMPIFIIMFKIIFKRYFKENGKESDEESKPLSMYKRIKIKVITPINEWIISVYDFIRQRKYYLLIALLLVLFLIKGYSIIIDLLGWYFYFISSFDFLSIYKTIAVAVADISAILLAIPLIIYLTVAYIVFVIVRKNIGYARLEYCENVNKGFISSLGVISLIDGPPKTWKTLTITDMAISQEEMFRTQALEILLEVSRLFPHFPYYNLEQELYRAVEFREIVNQVQIKKWMAKKAERFRKNPSKERIFGYDYENNFFKVYNGLYDEGIFDALSDYARAFFIYSLDCAYAMSNYAIRFDGIKIDKGYFPMWDYDYFRRDYRNINDISMYAKIIDYDAFRLGKKVLENNPKANIMDGCVVTFDEIDKEQGNQLDHKLLKKDDEEANPLNDLFHKDLKMIRHDCTIRNRCFVMVLMTAQRAMDLGANIRELSQYVLNLSESEKSFETLLPFWWIEPYISSKIVAWKNKLWLRYRFNRCDESLFMHSVNSWGHRAEMYLLKNKNTFDCAMVKISKSYGTKVDEKVREEKYFIMPKKIFSHRYTTSCFEGLKEQDFLDARIGFRDVEEYSSHIAKLAEFVLQHSYFAKVYLKDLI